MAPGEVVIEKETTVSEAKPLFQAAHDEAPAIVADHAFEPIAEWWSVCKHCRLAEAAHKETTLTGREHLATSKNTTGRQHIGYVSDENPDD